MMEVLVIEKIKKGEGTVIDVRTAEEYTEGHVAGSVNIPLHTVSAKKVEIADMAKPIVLCCTSGGRSGQAENFLRSNGVEEVYNGGSYYDVENWKE